MDLFGIKKRRNEKQFNQEVSLAIGQEINYFANAAYQHYKVYGELTDISHSKINPEYEATNYQQQSGFSAEVKNVARTNAENIMNGDRARIARTDNVGAVNHPQYDYILVDENNIPLRDADGNFLGGTQQKNFSRVENYDKLIGKDFEHYKDAKIAVPPDQYGDIIQRWDQKIASYKEQAAHLRESGNLGKAAEFEAKIKQIENAKSRTISSKVTTSDAMEARKSPLLSTVKDIGRVSHRAGMTAAKYGATIGGGISGVRNLYAVATGDKQIGAAVADVAVDTGKTAVISYAAGAASTAVGGALKMASNQICQTLSKGNAPAAIVNTGISLAKNVLALAKGDIDGEQFVKNIGQEGTTLAASMTGANLGAVVGTCIMPGIGSVVGGVVGGMIASMMSGAMHAELLKTIHETKLSDEQRKRIESYCKQLKQQEITYRENICQCLDYFLDQKDKQIQESFKTISNAISNGDRIHAGLLELGNVFNTELPFATTEDFKERLQKGETLHL